MGKTYQVITFPIIIFSNEQSVVMMAVTLDQSPQSQSWQMSVVEERELRGKLRDGIDVENSGWSTPRQK